MGWGATTVNGDLRVVLVDDEESTLRTLRHTIGDHPRFRVVREVTTGAHAVAVLQKLEPELVFLDVEMPDLGGFDVLRAIPSSHWPLVTFCSEREDDAVAAFEFDALDYLLKPLDRERAQRTLDRAVIRLGCPGADQRERMEHILTSTPECAHLERIPIRKSGAVEIVELCDVDWISAAGNYVELHQKARRHLYRCPLSELVARLDPSHFVRIHRSAVVNIERVREIEPTLQGHWKLRLDSGEQLRLSRHFRDALDRLAPLRSHHDRGS